MDDTLRVVCEIIAKITKREASEIKPEMKLAEDLGMKSVSRIELAALIEDRLKVVLGNFDIRKPKTIEDVVGLVKSKL